MTIKYTELIAGRAGYISKIANMSLGELIDEWMRLQEIIVPDTESEAQEEASKQLDLLCLIGKYVHGEAFSEALWHYKRMLAQRG